MHDMRKGVVLMIDYIQIRPKTSGFLVLVNHERPTPMEEFAYSDLDDLINGLIRLLGPIEPVVLTQTETVEDDAGWRVWEGWSKGSVYPSGVSAADIVDVRFRGQHTPDYTARASGLVWTHGDRDSDIIAYRVVRP
jgi:hypothetical protein